MAFSRTFAVLAAAAVLVAGCGHHDAAHPPSSSTSRKPVAAPAPPVCADPVTLGPRDKLAQLLMVGVKDADDAKGVVNDYHVGGIFIGSWTDLSIFDGPLNDIKNGAGPLALAVSIDEEGGRVSRLKKRIGPAPSAKELAQTMTPDQVHDLELDRGRKMHDLGITVDFAPDVDVVTNAPDDSVIGDRSFGADPHAVTRFANAYARGLLDAGVEPVFKHFPGHGRGSGDSHTGGVVTPSLDQMQDVDLVPFRDLVGAVPAVPAGVMVGHLQVPGLTGDLPASLSRDAVQMLRTGKGYGAKPFNGPIFSDDLSSMAAISANYSVPDAVLRTLQAGSDVALWVTTKEVPAVLDGLVKALGSGQLQMSVVNDALGRLTRMKGQSPKCAH
ncbi:glycoside hydrolase family 3 N-terminal domain-containing protein [Mycobacterium mantenii]|uniref:glycoside hydrolase family 3 N-terminal domain-containing protein n=1 Tax=Mycobacterium mantenii TaxID=560555 RepID=UPI0007FC8426|nr:glycoside hydrolase family 3 N-terminal domain-containing protein [Mycobacterium mantenii]OBH45538.1 beta-glucosidase [Mycobacterium mantenii]